MRKRISIFLSTCILFVLCACGQQTSSAALYVEPTQLTEGEKRIVSLLSNEDGSKIFDFHLDETVQSAQITTYELINGTWEKQQSAVGDVDGDAVGRIALTFDNIGLGLRVAVQGDGGSNAITTVPASHSAKKDAGEMGYTTTFLEEKTEAIYDQEIPLVMQAVNKGSVSSCALEDFDHPEELAEKNYAHVYAITVRFNQKSAPESADASQ